MKRNIRYVFHKALDISVRLARSELFVGVWFFAAYSALLFTKGRRPTVCTPRLERACCRVIIPRDTIATRGEHDRSVHAKAYRPINSLHSEKHFASVSKRRDSSGWAQSHCLSRNAIIPHEKSTVVNDYFHRYFDKWIFRALLFVQRKHRIDRQRILAHIVIICILISKWQLFLCTWI